MARYDGDPLLTLTPDGSDVACSGGLVAGSDGLQNAVTISLFGGNLWDSGLPADRKTWWGNLELPEGEQIRSETQALLRQDLPQTTGNLERYRQAIIRDLSWLVAAKIAEAVDGRATYPALGRVALTAAVQINGETTTYSFEPEP
jgi:phage gp46-like protein